MKIRLNISKKSKNIKTECFVYGIYQYEISRSKLSIFNNHKVMQDTSTFSSTKDTSTTMKEWELNHNI